MMLFFLLESGRLLVLCRIICKFGAITSLVAGFLFLPSIREIWISYWSDIAQIWLLVWALLLGM